MSRHQSATTALSSLQQVTLVVLRTVIGWHFVYEGYFKAVLPAWSPAGQPLPAWSSSGFLKGATGPLGALARELNERGLMLYIDKIIMIALVAIGLSLMLGLFTCWGCRGALALLALFYFTAVPTTGLPQAGAEGTYLLVNKTLIEGLAVWVIAAFDTGRIAGLDRLFQEKPAAAAVPPAARAPVGPAA